MNYIFINIIHNIMILRLLQLSIKLSLITHIVSLFSHIYSNTLHISIHLFLKKKILIQKLL